MDLLLIVVILLLVFSGGGKPYLTNTNVCPAGISVGEEINFTLDI